MLPFNPIQKRAAVGLYDFLTFLLYLPYTLRRRLRSNALDLLLIQVAGFVVATLQILRCLHAENSLENFGEQEGT